MTEQDFDEPDFDEPEQPELPEPEKGPILAAVDKALEHIAWDTYGSSVGCAHNRPDAGDLIVVRLRLAAALGWDPIKDKEVFLACLTGTKVTPHKEVL